MYEYFLHIEVVNYNNTIFDTSDLSSIRGASHAANLLPRYIVKKIEPSATMIVSSASQALAQFKSNKSKDKLEQEVLSSIASGEYAKNLKALKEVAEGDPQLPYLLPHLCFTYALVEDSGNFSNDLAKISLQKARRQFSRLSVDLPPPVDTNIKKGELSVVRPCENDGFRPRGLEYYQPDHNDEEGIAGVSHAVAWRRHFGRSLRRKEFYKTELGVNLQTTLGFTDSFEQIVQDPPKDISYVLKNKMCVLSMDMTKLGDQRQEAIDNGTEEYAKFSSNQNDVLKGLLKNFAEESAKDPEFEVTISKGKKEQKKLRFETLMLGGDEIMVIFPAWCMESGLRIISNFVEETGFAFGAGLVICHHKTPIRLAKELSDELCKSAKAGAKYNGFVNGLQFHLAGHLEFPDADLPTFRKKIIYESDNSVERAVTLDLNKINKIFEAVRVIKGVSGDKEIGLPRGHLVNYVTKAINGKFIFNNAESFECKKDGKKTKEQEFFLEMTKFIAEGDYKRNQNSAEPIIKEDLINPVLGGTGDTPLAGLFNSIWLWPLVRELSNADNHKEAEAA